MDLATTKKEVMTITSPQLERLDAEARSLLFTDARTANTFADAPVSDEELQDIWSLARWAPTAANTQPMRVLYVRTEEGKQRLVGHMSDGNKVKTASAPAVAVLAVDTRFHERIPEIFPMRPEMKDYFENDPAARESMGGFSAAMQAGYFVLAVRAAGLAAGPMGGFDKEALDADFFPDGRWRSLLVVNIGHPGSDPWFDRLPRLGHDTAVHWA
jgi:3-hydroxypropanoate dehydrogenase